MAIQNRSGPGILDQKTIRNLQSGGLEEMNEAQMIKKLKNLQSKLSGSVENYLITGAIFWMLDLSNI